MNYHGKCRYQIDDILIHLWMGFNTILFFQRYVRVIFLGLILALFVVLPLDSVFAQTDEPDVSIGFDFSFGEIIDGDEILSGTVISSQSDVVISWDIQNSTNFKFNWGVFNDLSDNLPPISENYFSLDWELSIDSNDYYSCSCEFNIYVELDGLVISEQKMPFFILNSNYVPDSINSLLVTNPSDFDWINGDLLIEAQASDISGNSPQALQVYLKRYITYVETCNSGISYSDDNEIYPIYDEENKFTHFIDMTSQPDGWYELVILIPSNNSFNQYDVSCISLRLNNLAPLISVLKEPSNQSEDNFIMVIDASMSSDPIWSEEELYYIWTCTSSESTEILVHEGYNQNIFELDSRYSADYNLKLEVMDKGGLSSTNEFYFTISNIIPSSTLFINGDEIFDGDDIKIIDIENIQIDGSNSMDSNNDIDSLRCIWSINSVTIFEGCDRILIWPENEINQKELVLRLDVMDNDGDYSSISVKLINPNVADDLPYPLIILFISFLFFVSSVFYRFKKDNESSSIPKWTKGK
jgi:hypothetical protein